MKRLAAVEGFPVTDFALVSETDLDLKEVRDISWNELAGTPLDVAPLEDEGSAQVTGIPGEPDETPELGSSGEG